MKIAIVNDIHVGKALMHNRRIRAASHLVEDRLEDILQSIVTWHAPDLLVNLGDLIRSEVKERDMECYARLLSIFNGLNCPVIHMLGNHEIKKMAAAELEGLWTVGGYHQKTFGSINIGGCQVLWLGLELDPKDERICLLPNDQLLWLKEQALKVKEASLIFIHCPVDGHDTSGNFFYEAIDGRSQTALFLDNQLEVREVIASFSNVKAVFQAHLHYYNVKLIGHLPYFTCPALGDNICAPGVEDVIPEIYTMVEIAENKLTVKAFSGEYCFAGFEQGVTHRH